MKTRKKAQEKAREEFTPTMAAFLDYLTPGWDQGKATTYEMDDAAEERVWALIRAKYAKPDKDGE